MTELDIYNKALAAIGRPRYLSTPASPFPEGVHCRREWPGARQAVLAAHEWGWLAVEIPLCSGTESTNEDTGQTVYLYPRPPAALRILAVKDIAGNTVKWSPINGQIEAPAEVYSIRYLPDSEALDEWPGAVHDAAIAEVAARIAIPLAKSPAAMKNMRQLAIVALDVAKTHDSSEVNYSGSSPTKYTDARR